MESLFSFQPVRPVSPPAAYIGGKKQLSNRLAAIIEQIPHATYAEPFVGMGGVFFRRQLVPKSEVINDRSGDVITLFRILQRHYPQFMETLKFQITSRREFERLKACDPSTLTDLERAARFLYLQRLSFGGKVSGRTYGVDTQGPGRFNINRLGVILEEVHDRLAGVIIENLDWLDFIDRYDYPGALFYLDPPYFGCEKDYGADAFSRSDFTRMAKRLSSIEGRFVLSLNDTPRVREIFAGFQFVEATIKYSISQAKQTTAHELIILDGRNPGAINV